MRSDFRITSIVAFLLCTVSSLAIRAAEPVASVPAQVAQPVAMDDASAGVTDPGAATTAQPPRTAQVVPAYTYTRGGATLTTLSPGNTGSASGISRNPSNNTTGDLTQQGVPLPNSTAVPPMSLFPSLGTTLLNAGIDLHGVAFDHFLANPTTGIVPGNNYNLGVLAPVADFDLQRILGIPGGNAHVQVTFFGVRSNLPTMATDTGGFLTGAQTTPAPSTTPVALSVLTYEQKLLNNRLSIEVGRSNPYHYFFIPNSIDPATYFSSVGEAGGDINSSPFPQWGGRTTYHFTPKFAVQGAAFEDNFFRALNNPDNFGDENASGVSTFVSLEYRSEFSNAEYPANAELGIDWDTRHGASNIKGLPIYYQPGLSAAIYSGGGNIFMQGMKVLWRGPNKQYGPPSNIAVYGQLDTALDKPQPFDFDTLAGVNFTGMIPHRPFDVLEAQVHYQRLSEIEANFETRLRNIFAGPGPDQQRDGFAFEIVASIQVTPWFAFKPLAEAFINPDSYYDAAQKSRAVNGFEFGFFGVVPIGRLLGTSTKPF